MDKIKKIDINMSLCVMSDFHFAHNIVSLWAKEVSFPIGIVIGRYEIIDVNENPQRLRYHVITSYVLPEFRRQGIRTRINRYLFNNCNVDFIYTHTGSDDGGLDFLKASGYKYDSKIGFWILDKKTHLKNIKSRGIDNNG